MSSRLRFVALVFVMAAIGLAIALISYRVDSLGVQLQESQADRKALHHQAEQLADQVRGLGEVPVVEPTSGTAGKTGPMGPAGPAGPRGPAGAPGADGKDGANGKTGATGADGSDGTSGNDGADGTQGEPGPAGPPGADGADGTNGADGANGKDGRSVESVSCDSGLGTFTFYFDDGTSQTVQCTPGTDPER